MTDEKKIEYKIDLNSNSPSKNSQTVAWEDGCEEDSECDDVDNSQDEEDEVDEEEKDD